MAASVINQTPSNHINGHPFGATVSSPPLINSSMGPQPPDSAAFNQLLQQQAPLQNINLTTPPTPMFPTYHDAICQQMYNEGFLKGSFSDLILHVPAFQNKQNFNVHAVVISRSPIIHQTITAAPNPTEITLHVNDPNVTEEAFGFALGHMYASSEHMTTVKNARFVFAAAYFLGLPDLCSYSAEIIKNDISKTTIMTYINFIEQGFEYESFSKTIKDECFLCLVRKLPKALDAFKADLSNEATIDAADELSNGVCHNKGYRELVKIYAQLPFPWLKRTVESRFFDVNFMTRYKFAKDVVQERRDSGHVALDEAVYLAFGTKNAHNITIIQRPPKHLRKTPTRLLYKSPLTHRNGL